jgi:cytochrome c553
VLFKLAESGGFPLTTVQEEQMSRDYFSRIAVLAGVCITILAISGCGTPEGNSEDGRRWYVMHNCNSCHGLHGNDGKALNIAGLSMSYNGFVKRLRTTGSPIMPYYPESKISDQDAADIYAYLKTGK